MHLSTFPPNLTSLAPDPHRTRTLASVCYSSRFLGRTRARQAFSGVFAAIATSPPGPPPDPYFGLRVLYLTFPWPNACPTGIFRCFCCNRHFSSRTPTGPVLWPRWAIPHVSLAERVPGRHFQPFLLQSPLLLPDPHRTRTLASRIPTGPWANEACALMTRHGCHVFHFS